MALVAFAVGLRPCRHGRPEIPLMTPIPTTNSERDKSRISLQIFRIHAMTIVIGPKEARSSGHLMAAEWRLWTT
jgi:hypothetical protein